MTMKMLVSKPNRLVLAIIPSSSRMMMMMTVVALVKQEIETISELLLAIAKATKVSNLKLVLLVVAVALAVASTIIIAPAGFVESKFG